MRHRRAAVLAVAVALVVGACSGGGDDENGGGASGDDRSTTTTSRSDRGTGACETLTRAQARAVVPGAGRGRASGTVEREATCEWKGDDGAVLRIRYERPAGPPATQVAAAAGDPVAVGDAAKLAVAPGPARNGMVTLVAAIGEALVTAEATGRRATPEAVTAAVREAIAYATR